MKALMLLLAVLVLTGCEDRVRELHYVLPSELEGCKIFRLESRQPSQDSITVVRCPGAASVTTNYSVSNGKHSRDVTNAVVEKE